MYREICPAGYLPKEIMREIRDFLGKGALEVPPDELSLHEASEGVRRMLLMGISSLDYMVKPNGVAVGAWSKR